MPPPAWTGGFDSAIAGWVCNGSSSTFLKQANFRGLLAGLGFFLYAYFISIQPHRRLPSARTAGEKMFSCQIEATNGQIDRLMYGLSGLTEDAAKIVEGK
jgi:hypothetical protein